MTRDELANHVDITIADAKARFTGPGTEKYQISETEQSFERSSVGVMLTGLREELLDAINYIVMLDILVQRRLQQLEVYGEDGIREGEDYETALRRECVHHSGRG